MKVNLLLIAFAFGFPLNPDPSVAKKEEPPDTKPKIPIVPMMIDTKVMESHELSPIDEAPNIVNQASNQTIVQKIEFQGIICTSRDQKDCELNSCSSNQVCQEAQICSNNQCYLNENLSATSEVVTKRVSVALILSILIPILLVLLTLCFCCKCFC